MKHIDVLPVVTEIEMGAFYRYSALTSISLPVGLQSIGVQAFECCVSLPSIVLPVGMKDIEYRAFCDCALLASVVFPKGMDSIGWDVFRDCWSLTSVVFPVQELQSVGNNVFINCDVLEKLSAASGHKSVESYIFFGPSTIRRR